MFVTFEGIDGVGKTTVLDALCQDLVAQNIPFCRTYEPGDSMLGRTLRKQILAGTIAIMPSAELFLFLADRAQHVEEIIRPALAQNKIVLCDRYIDSTIAYQGYGRGLDLQNLRFLNSQATSDLKPDLTMLLDLDVDLSMARLKKRLHVCCEDVLERFDLEKISFHKMVRAGYLEEARLDPKRYVIIDASCAIQDVVEKCREIFWSRLF